MNRELKKLFLFLFDISISLDLVKLEKKERKCIFIILPIEKNSNYHLYKNANKQLVFTWIMHLCKTSFLDICKVIDIIYLKESEIKMMIL